MAFFTLMYAGLARRGTFSAATPATSRSATWRSSAWARTREAILFNHVGIGSNGLAPFAVLPLIGISVGLVSVPIAWLALGRAR